jgi:hypothetical protein
MAVLRTHGSPLPNSLHEAVGRPKPINEVMGLVLAAEIWY